MQLGEIEPTVGMHDKRGAAPKQTQLAVLALVVEVTNDVGLEKYLRSMLGDVRYSQSLLMALLALAAFPGDGSNMDLVEVAGRFDWPSATTDRYFATWAALGAPERDAVSGRYRRALALTTGTYRAANTAGGAVSEG
jgi:hypothetical protein